jgi:hypothetical protein
MIAGGGAFRAALVALTFGNDGGVDSATEFLRKFVELRITIDFNGAFRSIANDVAVMAPLQMFLELGLGMRVHGVIEIICQLF